MPMPEMKSEVTFDVRPNELIALNEVGTAIHGIVGEFFDDGLDERRYARYITHDGSFVGVIVDAGVYADLLAASQD